MKYGLLFLSLLLIFPSSDLWARKKAVHRKKASRPAAARTVRRAAPELPIVDTPPPEGNSPVWNFWKNTLAAQRKWDSGDAQGALDLLKDLPTPPSDVMNKNQNFYRRLYRQALKIGAAASESLSIEDGKWARAQWSLFPDLEEAGGATPEGLRPEDKITRLHVLYQKGLYDDAASLLTPEEIASADVPDADRCRAYFELGQCLQKASRKDEAPAAYARAADASCDEGLRSRALYWKGMMESSVKDYAAAEETFLKLAKMPGKYADDAYDQLAKNYQAQNENDKADEVLSKLEALPAGDRKEKYLWDKAFEAIGSKDYASAAPLLDRIIDSKPLGTEAQPQALYWKARLEEIRSGKKLGGGSRALYGRLLKTYPFSFYAILAEARTGEAPALPSVAKGKETPPQDKAIAEAFKAVDELNRKKRHEDAAQVLDYLTHLHPELNKSMTASVARRWEESGDFNRALELSAEGLDQSAFDIDLNKDSPLTRTLYPLAYLSEAKKAAKDNRLPLGLIEGIMREESLFLKSVRSHAGAVGVMQLMPGTARLKAKALGVGYSYGDLSDPAANIELGASFLADLMDRFGGEMPLSVMGYNAGPGNVAKWLSAQGSLPYDEFIEAIPFTETRGYVKRVLRSAHVYGHLLGDRKSVKPFKSLEPPQ